MRVAPQPLPYEEPPVAAPPPDSKAAPSSSSAAPPKDEIRPLASIFPRTHHKKLAVSAEGAQTEEAQAVPSTPEAQNRYRPLSIFSRGGGAKERERSVSSSTVGEEGEAEAAAEAAAGPSLAAAIPSPLSEAFPDPDADLLLVAERKGLPHVRTSPVAGAAPHRLDQHPAKAAPPLPDSGGAHLHRSRKTASLVLEESLEEEEERANLVSGRIDASPYASGVRNADSRLTRSVCRPRRENART